MENTRVLQAEVSLEMSVSLYLILLPLCCIRDWNPIETQPEIVCSLTMSPSEVGPTEDAGGGYFWSEEITHLPFAICLIFMSSPRCDILSLAPLATKADRLWLQEVSALAKKISDQYFLFIFDLRSILIKS